MTKSYTQMSVLDALYTAARQYPGSVEALAARLGKSPKVLRNKLTPDADSHHLTLEEALVIIEMMDCVKPQAADDVMKAIGWRLNRVIQRHSGAEPHPSSMATQMMIISHAIGLLAGRLAALEDRQKLTTKEADAINADIGYALDALYLLKDSVEDRSAS